MKTTHHALNRKTLLLAVLLLAPLSLVAGTAGAVGQQEATATLPAWDQLTPEQRELLIAPMRERWDARPAHRNRMYKHAQRWHDMTPEQRQRARHGMHRFEHMDPEHRTRMRALFDKMRTMAPEQRKALREQWRGMSAEQRKAWVEANPPGTD